MTEVQNSQVLENELNVVLEYLLVDQEVREDVILRTGKLVDLEEEELVEGIDVCQDLLKRVVSVSLERNLPNIRELVEEIVMLVYLIDL